ncbi:MarR family transcriptional regulator [Saliphagus infecundisoli]|uniref:MarR family transcriptional regulator n=1 Tax=Saliphagus infecundisoli TaxID=1849069 RepID=A0ABD5QHW1_9EURY
MVNEDYRPNDREERVLQLFQEGRSKDEPWGRANPLYFRERTTLDKGQVEYALSNLTTAGWITKLNDGLYEFVEDPRE